MPSIINMSNAAFWTYDNILDWVTQKKETNDSGVTLNIFSSKRKWEVEET
jgi:hypothetical protein